MSDLHASAVGRFVLNFSRSADSMIGPTITSAQIYLKVAEPIHCFEASHWR